MDQKSSNSDQDTCLEKKTSKIWTSSYSEIIITDHIDKKDNEDEKDKATGLLSKTFCRFFIEEKPSNEELKFKFDKKELTFISLKSAIVSILKTVPQVNGNYPAGVQKFFNDLAGKNAETSIDEACEIALKFYTKFGKELPLVRRLNNAFQNQEKSPEYLVLWKFLHVALLDCGVYEKECVRAIDLDEKELSFYKKGSIINWKNFNSSSKGKDPVVPFDAKNTYFILSSITGRDISEKSSVLEEREVLFPPGCNFFVEDVEDEKVDNVKTGKTLITMKQVHVVFIENIVIWVENQFSDEKRQPRSKLYGQTSQYKLWIVEMPDGNEATGFIKEHLRGYLSQCKSLQIIVKSETLDDTSKKMFDYVNEKFNREICSCYLLKEGGGENIGIPKNYKVVNSEKNLMEDLHSNFKYKEKFPESSDQLNIHDINSEHSHHSLGDDLALNKKVSHDEDCFHSYQSEQDYSTQIPLDQLTQSGNFNSLIPSQQNQSLPNNHLYPESSSQPSALLKFKQTGGV